MKRTDRRRHGRRPVEGISLGSARATARVLNLSPGGMAVETSRSLRVGQRYEFRLRLDGSLLRLSATVRWCALRATRRSGEEDIAPVFVAGLDLERGLPPALDHGAGPPAPGDDE